MYIYHLQVFCPYMKKVKAFCKTEEDAKDKCLALFDEFFPWEDAFKRYNEPRVMEIIENGYSIVRIDTRCVKNYRALFKEGISVQFEPIRFRKEKEKNEDNKLPQARKRRISNNTDREGVLDNA